MRLKYILVQFYYLAPQVNATMFMGLLAVYTVLLAHYSSEEHICCGLPHAGRNRAETEGTLLHCFLILVLHHLFQL